MFKSWSIFLTGLSVGLIMSFGYLQISQKPARTVETTEIRKTLVSSPNAPEVSCATEPKIECSPCTAQNSEIPPLPAPEYHHKLPERLKTNYEGEVLVSWNEVLGAKSYRIAVIDLDEKTLKEFETSHTRIYLKGLPAPASGQEFRHVRVRLATLNAHGVVGPFGAPKDLFIKQIINLTAPSIKEIRIED